MCVYIAIQTARQLNNVKRRATFPLPSPTPSLATTTVATAAPSPFPALCLPSGAVNQPVELAALLPCCPRLSQTNHNCYNLLKAELGRRRKGERGRVREGEGEATAANRSNFRVLRLHLLQCFALCLLGPIELCVPPYVYTARGRKRGGRQRGSCCHGCQHS